jgi:hypothetical protein
LAVHLGGSKPNESYLDIDKVVGAAKATGCDALHPGYGFLSENEDAAQALGISRKGLYLKRQRLGLSAVGAIAGQTQRGLLRGHLTQEVLD